MVSQRTPKPGVTARTREAVKRRDGGQCIVAGFPTDHVSLECFGDLTMQHTVGRGMGGSRLFDTPDLLVTMCYRHNVLLTVSAPFAALGKARGWVKDRNATRDPRLTPVLYGDGWFRLVEDRREPVRAIDAVEYMQLIGAIRLVGA